MFSACSQSIDGDVDNIPIPWRFSLGGLNLRSTSSPRAARETVPTELVSTMSTTSAREEMRDGVLLGLDFSAKRKPLCSPDVKFVLFSKTSEERE